MVTLLLPSLLLNWAQSLRYLLERGSGDTRPTEVTAAHGCGGSLISIPSPQPLKLFSCFDSTEEAPDHPREAAAKVTGLSGKSYEEQPFEVLSYSLFIPIASLVSKRHQASQQYPLPPS